jgi:hypothetical protein
MAKSIKSLFSFLNIFGKTKKRGMRMRKTRKQIKTRKGRKATRKMRGG